jgi:hypothetical protein
MMHFVCVFTNPSINQTLNLNEQLMANVRSRLSQIYACSESEGWVLIGVQIVGKMGADEIGYSKEAFMEYRG